MSNIQFNEEKHEYSLNGKNLISTTTFLKQFFPEFDEKRMAKLVAAKRRRQGELNDKGKPITAREVKKEWAYKRDVASSRGSLVHYEIELYINEPETYRVLEDVYHPMSVQGVEWLQDYDQELTSELIVYDEELGIAGTIDLVVNWDEEGEISLVDWKTSREISKKGYGKGILESTKHLPNANYYKYSLQLSVYAYILERQGYKIRDLTVVHLKEDEAVPYKVDYLKDVVEAMFNEVKEDE